MTHNEHDPMLPHGTDKCKCSVCGLYFNSTFAFSQHLRGPVTARVHYTPQQMLRRGWFKTATGHWATERRGGKGRHKVDAPSDTEVMESAPPSTTATAETE